MSSLGGGIRTRSPQSVRMGGMDGDARRLVLNSRPVNRYGWHLVRAPVGQLNRGPVITEASKP